MRQFIRRYKGSKFRIALFLALMAGAIFIASTGSAADTSGAAASKPHTGLFTVIMSNKDPVFFLIMLCSIAGVTLITIVGASPRRAEGRIVTYVDEADLARRAVQVPVLDRARAPVDGVLRR